MINEQSPVIAVCIPCYNEELTIAKVINDFRHILPEARIIVFDNNSTDDSVKFAIEAGAEIMNVRRQGKGSVMRDIFRKIDADVYLTVDGDDACPASSAHDLITPVINGEADMVMGDRLSEGSYIKENKRMFHHFGNRLVCQLVNRCFSTKINDVMCGYRAFSRIFAKNVPISSDGFQVETELTIKCLDRKLPFAVIPISFKDRPEGSFSKLSTFKDGLKVLLTIFSILKDYRPMFFFGFLSLVFFALGLFFGTPVIRQFIIYGQITIFSSAVLATGLVLIATIFLICALILDTIVLHEKQLNELFILQFKKDELRARCGGWRKE